MSFAKGMRRDQSPRGRTWVRPDERKKVVSSGPSERHRPSQERPAPSRPQGSGQSELRLTRGSETLICGLHACSTRYARRPESIVRAYFTAASLKTFGGTARKLAELKRAYHIVDNETLAKVSGTVHHEGVCFLVRTERPLAGVDDLIGELKSSAAPLLILDGVANPHNLGAIARVAAHYGASALIIINSGVPDPDPRAEQGPSKSPVADHAPSFFRTAQGGAEFLKRLVLRPEQVTLAFRQLERAGFVLIGTCSHRGDAVYDVRLPQKVAFVLGSENSGISAPIKQLLKRNVSLPGTGFVESLNVACAASGLLLEHWRQNHGRMGAQATSHATTH